MELSLYCAWKCVHHLNRPAFSTTDIRTCYWRDPRLTECRVEEIVPKVTSFYWDAFVRTALACASFCVKLCRGDGPRLKDFRFFFIMLFKKKIFTIRTRPNTAYAMAFDTPTYQRRPHAHSQNTPTHPHAHNHTHVHTKTHAYHDKFVLCCRLRSFQNYVCWKFCFSKFFAPLPLTLAPMDCFFCEKVPFVIHVKPINAHIFIRDKENPLDI